MTTSVKEWTVGKGKTKVHLRWTADTPQHCSVTTDYPVAEITEKQYDVQDVLIRRTLRHKLGGFWEANGSVETNEDKSETCGYSRVEN